MYFNAFRQSGKDGAVIEKQLRSISKDELFEMLLQQELIIEQLNSEKEEAKKWRTERSPSAEQAGPLAEASLKLSGIFEAAQNAADIYLENLKAAEAEKIAAASQIQNELRDNEMIKFNEAERKYNEATSRARRILQGMQNLIDWHLGQLVAARVEFHDLISQAGLSEFIKSNESETGSDDGTTATR